MSYQFKQITPGELRNADVIQAISELPDTKRPIEFTDSKQITITETFTIEGLQQQLVDLDAQKVAIQAKIDAATLALNIKP